MTTFNYSSKSSIKDNLTEILIGAALIIIPIVYPFGIKVGTLRILGPLPTAIILALVGLYMLFRAWRKIHIRPASWLPKAVSSRLTAIR